MREDLVGSSRRDAHGARDTAKQACERADPTEEEAEEQREAGNGRFPLRLDSGLFDPAGPLAPRCTVLPPPRSSVGFAGDALCFLFFQALVMIHPSLR